MSPFLATSSDKNVKSKVQSTASLSIEKDFFAKVFGGKKLVAGTSICVMGDIVSFSFPDVGCGGPDGSLTIEITGISFGKDMGGDGVYTPPKTMSDFRKSMAKYANKDEDEDGQGDH